MAFGDLDGDNKDDMVVANRTANTVSMFMGDGQGGFSSKIDLVTGAAPRDVVIHDFNGDTFLDIAVADSAANSVLVFLGNGHGAFVAKPPRSVGAGPTRIVAADPDDLDLDFNADGNADMVVANSAATTFTLLRGAGDGTFPTTSALSVAAAPVAIAVGDFNDDLNPDVVVLNTAGNAVIRLAAVDSFGDVTGGFVASKSFAMGLGVTDMSVRDLDGDGYLDLAAVNPTNHLVSIRWGNGADSLLAAFRTDVPVAGSPTAIAVGALGSLNDNDIVLTSLNSADAIVLHPTGTRTFGDVATFPTLSTNRRLVLHDLDGDGTDDLVVASANLPSLVLLHGDGSGGFDPAPVHIGGAANAVAFDDVTGDLQPDVVVVDSSAATLRVFQNDGLGSFALSASIAVGAGARGIALTDLNLDTRVDVVTANAVAGSVSVLLQDGTGALSPPTNYGMGAGVRTVLAADVNADMLPDLISVDETGGTVTVRRNLGAGAFGSPTSYAVGLTPVAASLGDFNKDGPLDLLVACRGSSSVAVLLGKGDGTFQAAVVTPTTQAPLGIAVLDLDGDGWLDAVLANAGVNSVSGWIGNHRTGFTGHSDFALPAAPQSLVAGPFNCDLFMDLAVVTSDGLVRILTSAANGQLDQVDAFGSGAGIPVAATGYLDGPGDGPFDLVALNVASGTVALMANATGCLTQILDAPKPKPFRESVALSIAPNPARSGTDVTLTLPQAGRVSVHAYDAFGRRLRTLMNENATAGTIRLHWDGRNDAGTAVAPGMYFVRAELGRTIVTKRITFVR